MKLEELHREVAKDFEIKKDQLDQHLIAIPDLLNKWFSTLSRERLVMKGLEREYKALLWAKREYYMGNADDEVYRQKPLDRKILKGDVGIWLDADPELAAVQTKIDIFAEKVALVERMLKALDRRGFEIKSILDFWKWSKGQEI